MSQVGAGNAFTVLPLTRHVKSMLNWCYVDINTASNVLSCNSNKNSKNNKEGFCALSCYCTKQVLCNKHFLFFGQNTSELVCRCRYIREKKSIKKSFQFGKGLKRLLFIFSLLQGKTQFLVLPETLVRISHSTNVRKCMKYQTDVFGKLKGCSFSFTLKLDT